MRPIDADALQDRLDWDNDIERWTLYWINDLDEMPTLDVEPVRKGKWIKKEDNDKETIECAACGAYWCYRVPSDIYLSDANYCPNCGAKMEASDGI